MSYEHATRKMLGERSARAELASTSTGSLYAGLRLRPSTSNSGGWGVANVIVVGGGPTGLTAAMKFAGAGASVTVLERDPAPMPDSPTDAWEHWDRRAVPQFRQIHYLQPGGRWALEEHLPSVIDELRGVGAIELHPDVIFRAPGSGPRPGSDVRDAHHVTSSRSRVGVRSSGSEDIRCRDSPGSGCRVFDHGTGGHDRCPAHRRGPPR